MRENRNLLFWGLLASFLAYGFYPTFLWMFDRWTVRDSYYGHGFLIPLVAGYWIYRRRGEILPAASFNGTGIALVVAALGVQALASFFRIYSLSAFSFVILLIGTSRLLFTGDSFRRLCFPICFLFLMIPLPLLVISEITLKMKFWVSEAAVFLLNQMNIHAVREGSYIHTPNAVLLIGDPCSGVRSFLAFLCLGLIFAYESKITFDKRIILAVSGLPLAFISNMIRVLFLGLVAEIYGTQAASGWIHDSSGIFVFIFAFSCFLGIKTLLEAKHAVTV